jgi:5-formyltetrahydrofolate cyclo-ligase
LSRGRKGAGYAGSEIALLIEAELIDERTTITTTVHELLVLDEDLPELPHDFHVDLIATPGRVIWCNHPKRPAGIDWSSLRAEQIAAIPVLARRFLTASKVSAVTAEKMISGWLDQAI